MGVCFSAIRVTGASSSRQTNNNNKKACKKTQENKPATNTNTNTKRRTTTGSVPCGKRTEFGYAKDFHERYSIGKLLGHGQFGYTYVAIDKVNGDRVAVKRLDKTKVLSFTRGFNSNQSIICSIVLNFISTTIYYSLDSSIFDSPKRKVWDLFFQF